MALPPVDAGALKVTVALPLPAVALTPAGAPGTVNGVTGLEAPGPVPAAFVAVNVKV